MSYSLSQGNGWSVMHDHGDVRVATSKDLMPVDAVMLAKAIEGKAREAAQYRKSAVELIEAPTTRRSGSVVL